MRYVLVILQLFLANLGTAQTLNNYEQAWADFSAAVTCFTFLPDRTWLNLARAEQKILLYEAKHEMNETEEDLSILWEVTINQLDPEPPEEKLTVRELAQIELHCRRLAFELTPKYAHPKYETILAPITGFTEENLVFERILHDEVVTCYGALLEPAWEKAASDQLDYLITFTRSINGLSESDAAKIIANEEQHASRVIKREFERDFSFKEFGEILARCDRVKKHFNSAPDRSFN